AVRRLARELGVDLGRVAGSGPVGRITAEDVRGHGERWTEEKGPRRAISPRARRVARELGVDWSGLAGSGRGGRVRERDVRVAASGSGQGRLVPHTAARRT